MQLILNEGRSDYVGLLFDFMIKIHIVSLNLVSIKQCVKNAGPEGLHRRNMIFVLQIWNVPATPGLSQLSALPLPPMAQIGIF